VSERVAPSFLRSVITYDDVILRSLSVYFVLCFSFLFYPLSTADTTTTHIFLYIKSGLCPDNLFFHAVTCQLVKLELEALNFVVNFATVEVEGGAAKEGTWEGLRRKYWHGREEYYLPGERTLSHLIFLVNQHLI